MRVAVLFAVLAVASLSTCLAVSPVLKSRLRQPQTPKMMATSFAEFQETGTFVGDDPFSQIQSLQAKEEAKETTSNVQTVAATSEDEVNTAFVEVSTQKVRSFCEICILVIQMKQRGQPHLCAGLNANYYITCVEVVESLLRADKALVYWLKNGCMHMDSTGPEIVRPCPALPICGWVPNLFAQPPSLVRDGVESLCPKDPKFLPTIPNEYKTLLQPQTNTEAGPTS